MEYIRDLATYTDTRPAAVTLGKFDGVHLGHRQLLAHVRREAREHGWKTAVFTFSQSPQVVMGQRKGQVLTTNEERAELLREMDVDLLVELPFTPALRDTEAADFVRDIFVQKLHAKAIVLGSDARFGKHRAGSAELLKKMGPELGFTVDVVEKVADGAQSVSSTMVREALLLGRMEEVSRLLGRPFVIGGTIVHGRHLGHSLGFPTINMAPPPEKILPPFGVYFSVTKVAGRSYQGISNLGMKPTVGGSAVGLETYLFDCSDDLYGLDARVSLLTFERPELKFHSIDALKAQMEADIVRADRYFEVRAEQ